MNRQEIFDKVAAHLLTQKAKSLKVSRNDGITGEECRYRGMRGMKCAVGCLIPDELYNPDMEGKRVGALLEHFPQLHPFFFDEHETLPTETISLLDELQGIHDTTHMRNWTFNLRAAARNFRLDARVIDSLTQ